MRANIQQEQVSDCDIEQGRLHGLRVRDRGIIQVKTAMTAVHEVAVGLLFVLLAGGVILDVLKEGLREERRSRFWAFALGAFAYASILIVPLQHRMAPVWGKWWYDRLR